MKLETWLEKEGKSASAFSKELGFAHSTIRRVLNDDRAPSDLVMKAVVVGTKGQVLPNDFFDLDELLKQA